MELRSGYCVMVFILHIGYSEPHLLAFPQSGISRDFANKTPPYWDKNSMSPCGFVFNAQKKTLSNLDAVHLRRGIAMSNGVIREEELEVNVCVYVAGVCGVRVWG